MSSGPSTEAITFRAGTQEKKENHLLEILLKCVRNPTNDYLYMYGLKNDLARRGYLSDRLIK